MAIGSPALPGGAGGGGASAANQATIITHLSQIEAAVGAIQALDLMLGTDFSNVFGTASLISATPAVKVEQQGSVAITNAGLTELEAAINASNQMDVNIAASGVTVPVSGTFWQATQPVSGTFWQTTQPVSATNLDIRDLTHISDSVKIGDGTDIADVLDLTNANPLAVAILDADGTQITSFGGGTQYTEGDTDAFITGTAALMEIAGDALAPIQGTVAGGLLVNLGANNDITLAILPDTAATDLALQTADLDTIAGDTTAIQTAIELLDNAVDGNYLNVNLNLAGTDVSATVPLPVRPNEYELTGNTTHVKKYYTNAGAVTDGIIWSPAAGKRLYSGEDVADLIITTTAGNVYCTVVGYEV